MPPEQNTQGSANNDKGMAIVAYIIFFIPLLISKNRSAFLNFHINQGLSLFIVAIVGNVVLSFLGYMIVNVWGLLMLVLVIMGIMNASNNQMKELPVIGSWFKLIK
jgi:uncharacterized membrane protein